MEGVTWTCVGAGGAYASSPTVTDVAVRVYVPTNKLRRVSPSAAPRLNPFGPASVTRAEAPVGSPSALMTMAPEASANGNDAGTGVSDAATASSKRGDAGAHVLPLNSRFAASAV
jgi:hypothetical protein